MYAWLKQRKNPLIFVTIIFFLFLSAGYLDVPQSDVGVIVHKEVFDEDLYAREGIGLFTLKLENKLYPFRVYYYWLDYDEYHAGDKIYVYYRAPLLPWRKTFAKSHEEIE